MSGNAPPLWNTAGPRPTPLPPSHHSGNQDLYNNNPYSRNAAPVAPGGGNEADPWNWGWDETQGAQDDNDWGSGFHQVGGAPASSAPSVTSAMGGAPTSTMAPQQRHFTTNSTPAVNNSDFFENIDLSGKAKFQDMYSTSNNHMSTSVHHQHHHNHHQQQQQQSYQLPPQQQHHNSQEDHSYSYFQFTPNSMAAENQMIANASVDSSLVLQQQQQPQQVIMPPTSVNQFQTAGDDYSYQNSSSVNTKQFNYFQSHYNQPQPQQPVQIQQYEYNNSLGVESYSSYLGSQQPSSFNANSFANNNTINVSKASPPPPSITKSASSSLFGNVVSAAATEVENIEVAPPEKPPLQDATGGSGQAPPPPHPTSTPPSDPHGVNSNVPENQENVPENEEHPLDPDLITSQMNSLQINNSLPPTSASSADSENIVDQTNSTPGWENQEVAPTSLPVSTTPASQRCNVDRNQYLETGHLSTNPAQPTVDNDADTNDEGEAAPPPGLHRLVTGQVTPNTESFYSSDLSSPMTDNGGASMQRMVVGSGPEPPISHRLVPGQGNSHSDAPNASSSDQADIKLPGPQQRLVSGHSDSLEQRQVPGQGEAPPPMGLQRLVTGQVTPSTDTFSTSNMSSPHVPDNSTTGMHRMVVGSGPELPLSQRLVPGQVNSRLDPNASSSDQAHAESVASHQRLVPGQGDGDGLDRRQVPGQGEALPPPGLNRLVTGQVTPNTDAYSGSDLSSPPLPDYSSAGMQRMVVGSGPEPPLSQRLVPGQGNTRLDSPNPLQSDLSVSEPSAPQQRLVPGQGDKKEQRQVSRQGMCGDEPGSGGNNLPPPGLHRMVLGEFREKDTDLDRSRDKDTDPEDREKDRDTEYSDSEYRLNRRKPRPRRDYDHSPEYRSEDDYDYRDQREKSDCRDLRRFGDRDRERDRDRDRERGDRDRDRGGDRERVERRRRSPSHYYREEEYKEDQRRPRDRRHHYDSHYRDEDYYYRENRSRPTSRSGSDYRRAGPPRDYISSRHHSSYYSDQGAVNPFQYYYTMQNYYEEMRRNDPQAYALFYEQYMAGKYTAQSVAANSTNYDTDRASVHSGRSSANGTSQHHSSAVRQTSGEKDLPGDELSKVEDDVASQRYTPHLFRGAHIKCRFNKQGQLVVVNPNYSQEGQTPSVSLMQLNHNSLQNDRDLSELLECPGPFVVGITHKSTVCQYLKKRSDQSSHSSEKLLYDLIQLVIRLNGVVDMTDVAELLMTSYRGSRAAEREAEEDAAQDQPQPSTMNGAGQISQQRVISKFRDLLLQGNKLEALEWAIQNKNWGHAFFLASKMDTRSYNNVVLRFANGVPANDPLQTLYQTMSGREPQAATCSADKKWSDWRPHLAMILSNPSGNPELDRKSIITLGDSLGSRGRLFASHFCYLTAQVEFSNYTDRSAKLVLLGSSHQQPFAKFASCRAIMLSLCYEYAVRLNKKDLIMPSLQTYKYLLAVRLAENGKLSIANQYLEYVAMDIINCPSRQNRPLALVVTELADQLKIADPGLMMMNDPDEDPEWLNNLKQLLDDSNETNMQTSSMSRGISTSTVSTSGADAPPINQSISHWQGLDPIYGDSNLHSWNNQQQQQPLQYDSLTHDNNGLISSTVTSNSLPYQQTHSQPGFPMDGQLMNSQPIQSYTNDYSMPQTVASATNIGVQQHWEQTPVNSWQQQQQTHLQPNDMMQPTTMPHEQHQQLHDNYNSSNDSHLYKHHNQAPPQLEDHKSQETKPSKTEKPARRSAKGKEQESSGWFGGIWNSFKLRPKNQMKLPDDKNPSIVWDKEKQKWVNTDADEEDEATQMRPPPKASEIPGFISSTPQKASTVVDGPPPPSSLAQPPAVSAPASQPLQPISSNPPASGAPSVNMYKMKRGKGMKTNYIDIMNPNSNKQPLHAAPEPTVPGGLTAPPPSTNNFFIPSPVEGIENAPIDFLSPSGPVSYESSSHHNNLDQHTKDSTQIAAQEPPALYYR